MRARLLAMWSVAVFAVAAAFITYLALRFETVRLGYELDARNREHKSLEEKVRLLSLEAQSLREHTRVSAIASRTLGMQVPDKATIVPVGQGAQRARPAGRAR